METTNNANNAQSDKDTNVNQNTPERKLPISKEDEQTTDEEENAALKKELDTNFPLSGGGTEPLFKNEGA